MMEDKGDNIMKCCGLEMMERSNFDSKPIYWCSQCGKKVPRKTPVLTSESTELDDLGEVDKKGEMK